MLNDLRSKYINILWSSRRSLEWRHNLERHSRATNSDPWGTFALIKALFMTFIVQAANCGITYDRHLWSHYVYSRGDSIIAVQIALDCEIGRLNRTCKWTLTFNRLRLEQETCQSFVGDDLNRTDGRRTVQNRHSQPTLQQRHFAVVTVVAVAAAVSTAN